MNKLKAILGLFKQGNAVSNPELWKNRQITATVLAGVILALVHVLAVFGFAVPIDTDTASAIAAGVIAVVNVVLTLTTSDKVGLPQSEPKQPLPEIDQDSIMNPKV
jgi:hypothetical protein